MRIQSPLSNIGDVLSQLKESASRYQQTLVKNEAATRAVLVDPVLRALGWETSNTYMVEVERTFSGTRVDYALYDSNTNVKVIIEAKALGANLNQASTTMALVTYAFTYGLQDIFLTDGLVWQHFTNFQPGNVVPAKMLDIAKDDPIECAAYLVQRLDAAKFWPEEQTIDTLAQQVTQLSSIVATLQQDVARMSVPSETRKDRSLPATNPFDGPMSAPPATPTLNYIGLSNMPDATRPKPSSLRLPDGSIVSVKVWKDVLLECCKFVLANCPDLPIPFPDRAGRKVRLFDTDSPPKGITHTVEQYAGTMIYVYLNYDANGCIANARHALAMLPAERKWSEAAVVYA
jgi:hypothetical protein